MSKIFIKTYPEYYKVKPPMSGMQSKITKHTKKGEYKTYSQEKSQPIEANPEVTQAIEFIDKDLKINIINLKNKLKVVRKTLT